jgi:signal transduction histidine kinase/CheY-like chemotaxis protein
MLAQLGRELGIDSPETGLVARGPRSGLLLFVLGPNEWLGASDVAWSLSTAVSLLAAAIHRSEAEQTLAQGQKMGALGRLSAGIAHDFNNLLTTILGGTELVEHKMQADPAMRAHLRGIREAGERAASLTSKLMTFTLASPREPKPVEVGGVVHDLIPVIRRSMEESIEITFDLPDEELWIDADSIDVERVVLNLMASSRDAMGLNGRVDLGVEAREDAQVGEQVVIWVQDDGEGMDRPTRAQVFEPFFSTRRGKGATGLGLSIVYGLVQGLGGEIYVDSAPGKGSCFEVVLPRQMDPILPEERTQSAIQSGAGKAVLLVEDDPDVRDIVCEMLRLGGFEVVVADGGENALGILSERTGFSLVLTDVVMPSMSGFDLAEQIQEQELDVPIALISGYAAGGRAGAAGAEMSLPRIAKPFSLDELLGFVHRQLR